MFGLDYVAGPPVAAMQKAGVGFVCRYLSYVNALTQTKILAPTEAMALAQAGISIVSNYEWYGNRALEGYASGVQDAQIAANQHAACGGPVDRPIYFSVDFDTPVTPAILAYFHGIASVIGLARTGAYGSYSVIKGLFDAGAITWGWQTYAWSGGLWESRAHIQQYQNGVSLAGASVDYDRSIKADFGQWMPGGDVSMLQLSDPIGKYFVSVADPNGTRWHCTKTNQDIAYALLDFYRQYGGIFGLPTTGEIYLQNYVGAAFQWCERGLLCYDPKRVVDNPPGAGDCYLLHLDAGIGQQAIAKPLLTALQTQVDALTQQVSSLTGELTTLKAQPTPDTSALDAQITALTAQVEAYKQAVTQIEATFAALPK